MRAEEGVFARFRYSDLTSVVPVQLLPIDETLFPVVAPLVFPRLRLGFGGGGKIGRHCGAGFFCGASSLFLLGTLFGFGALFFQPLHFFLALLERDAHEPSSQVRSDWVNEKRELPAGFARLARGFAVIFVRESSAATAMTTAGASAAITAGAVAFRPGFVDLEIAAAELFAIEARDSVGGFRIIGHFDKGEAASPAGFAIGDNMNAPDLAEGLEQRSQICFRGLKTHISDKKTFHTTSPFVLFRCRQSLFMGSVSPRIFIERADQTGTCGMTEFAQGLRFNLADALASDVKSLTDFFESARITVLKTKTHADDALFARIQVLQHASDVFLEAEADGGVRGRGHGFIFNKVAEVGFFLFADWRLKRDGSLSNFAGAADFFDGDIHAHGQLFRGRLAAKFLNELPGAAGQLVNNLDHVDGNADRACLVGNRASDALANPPGGVG